MRWPELELQCGIASEFEIWLFMLEEVIMKSNESESGCKTKLTNKLTNKTNEEQM